MFPQVIVEHDGLYGEFGRPPPTLIKTLLKTRFFAGCRMSNGRSSKLWIINLISFILFILLSGTGLLNWFVLPRGYEARGSFLVSLRHFFIALHEWTASIFMIVVAVHIILHWPYIKSNLKKYRFMK